LFCGCQPSELLKNCVNKTKEHSPP